eukprot:Plantae.Rhodophyta-Hildenbrandia_rubra.ctg8121.p2 GENE.Plantae.Rhodophyta-Hildenbrandia_rubra.ctg8121~~Plantae.Rhodophyta-Hildenbrandia_rubra.ctg8121.p2  ORF type:complete len:421 (-),score=83.77 Plantae.Rhodophyta-Hildenbrandia_rubra.ctg8121:2264-3442(-)
MATTEGEVIEEKGIDSPDVLTKYQVAADIANKALSMVIKAANAGVPVIKLCQVGDKFVVDGTSAVYNKAKTEKGEKIEKGLAFPTCVSVNNCAAHFCPIPSDTEFSAVELKEGDLVSVQLAAHIDGHIAMAAQTTVAKASMNAPVLMAKGRQADVMVAAYTAAQAVLRVLRPGKSNQDVTNVIAKVGENYKCKPIEGVLSHKMKRHVIDSNKTVMNKPTADQRVEESQFEENEVYAIDIAMSTGEGKVKEMSARATVFKRQVEVDYRLKMRTSRAAFSEINSKYPALPFTLRALSDPKRARLGMTEIVSHNLVVPYPVLYEKEGEYCARVIMTIMILPGHTNCITQLVEPPAHSEITLADEDIKALLAQSIAKKKKKKKANVKNDSTAMETD